LVGSQLEALGLARLDTDRVARDVVLPGTEGLNLLVSRFGREILGGNGELDRAALAKIVFSEPAQKKVLEETLHPLIWSQVEDFQKRCLTDRKDAVVEVPLLFENGREHQFDSVWVVATNPVLQQERLRERNGWSPQEIEARVRAQMPLAEKVRRADVVLHNEGSSQELAQQVERAWRTLKSGNEPPA
jgi:dephospho-CoA kinase